MTEIAQHGLHPDAERLNAFAEQALGESERDQVLRHLAVCGRCRQVVALSHEAAQEEEFGQVAAIAAAHPVVQPTAWWKRWRLVWAPAAMASALAVTSVSVYLRQVEHRNAAIRIAEPSQEKDAAAASAPPPRELAEAAPPPASPAVVAPAAKTPKARASGATPGSAMPGSRQRQHDGLVLAGKMQSLAQPALDQPAPAQPPFAQPPAAPINLAQGSPGEGFMSGAKPTMYKSSASMKLQTEKKEQDLERQQAQAGALHASLFAASAAPAAGTQSTGNSTSQGASDQTAAAAEQPAPRAASAASFGALGQLNSGLLTTAHVSGPPYLPSGLRTISIASSGDRRIALDEAGTLFVSVDAGQTWESVPRQWTGRPTMVRRAPESHIQQEPPAAQASGNQPGAAEPSTPAVFEMVNDAGQAWLSADGKTWTAK